MRTIPDLRSGGLATGVPGARMEAVWFWHGSLSNGLSACRVVWIRTQARGQGTSIDSRTRRQATDQCGQPVRIVLRGRGENPTVIGGPGDGSVEERGMVDVNSPVSGYHPLLWCACRDGAVELVHALLGACGWSCGVVVKSKCLVVAAEEGNAGVARLLVDDGRVDVNKSFRGQRPLFAGVLADCVETMRVLLATPGIQPWKRSRDGYTALHVVKSQ